MLYIQAVRKILDHLELTQEPAIDEAAEHVANALSNKGAVFCYEIGHANQHDFLNRAGGLAGVQAFGFGFTVTDPIPAALKERAETATPDRDLQSVQLAVKTSNLRAGDVMLLGSVSGKNRVPVELAIACRQLGVKVIAFTSMAYTLQVQSLHPTGKRLFEVADVVIDNGAPYGDAACQIPGLDVPALPVSGVSCLVAGWLIWERAIDKMIARGTPPTVFLSVNRDGGPEFYQKMREQYEQRGY